MCFLTDNKLHKILNKNTIKLSYSYIQNMKQIISSHNKTALEAKKINKEKLATEGSASKREWYTRQL